MEQWVSKLGRFWMAVPASVVAVAWVASLIIFLPAGEDETATSASRASDVVADEDVLEELSAGALSNNEDDDAGPVDDSTATRPTIDLTAPVGDGSRGADDPATDETSNDETNDDVAPTGASEDTAQLGTAEQDTGAQQTSTASTTPNDEAATATPSTTTPEVVQQGADGPTTTSTTTPTSPTTSPEALALTAADEAPPAANGQGGEETASPRGRLTGVSLFADPTNTAAQWAANNPSDPRAGVIADQIGNQPIARWFGEWSGDITAAVSTYVNEAAAADSVPMLVVYFIPDRDCGLHSSGGAPSFDAYDAWISDLAAGLGDDPAIIILEPDAIAMNGCAGSGRNIALSNAVNTIKNNCRQCRVYLDAGHSNWVAPSEMASRLISAGLGYADGFSTNISNYNLTADEVAYGAEVLAALGNPTGIGQVIDVSRNGNGSNGEWCDPSGRALGVNPTVSTGVAHVHAYMWIKVPGEADGCAGSAGTFLPDQAAALANNRR